MKHFELKNFKKIIFAIIIGVVVGIGFIITYLTIRKNYKLPKNACFLNHKLENLNYEEVKDFVETNINSVFEKKEIKLKVRDKTYSFKPSRINASFNPKDVFNIAKKNAQNINEKEKNENEFKVNYDKKKMKDLIQKLNEKTRLEPKKFKHKIVDNILYVKNGDFGEKLDEKDITLKIENSLKKLDFNEIIPKILKFINEDSVINLKELKEKINTEAKDATYQIVNGKRKYEKETIGVEFNLKEAKKIVTNRKKGLYKIPIKITKPSLTVEDLKRKHQNSKTPHVLSSFTTNFKAGGDELEENRNQNIRIAASALNGVVLLPGEEFSFKSTAGSAGGYLPAVVYEKGKKSTGIGGGICQVSTTTFNAALKANMEITERKCHSRTVGYVPKGRDAAYDGAGPNLRFINKLKNPVRIQTTTTNSSITVNILGTKIPEENYNVILDSKVTSKTEKIMKAILNVTVTLNGKVVKTKSFSSSYNIEKE